MSGTRQQSWRAVSLALVAATLLLVGGCNRSPCPARVTVTGTLVDETELVEYFEGRGARVVLKVHTGQGDRKLAVPVREAMDAWWRADHGRTVWVTGCPVETNGG